MPYGIEITKGKWDCGSQFLHSGEERRKLKRRICRAIARVTAMVTARPAPGWGGRLRGRLLRRLAP